jgi:hypothetical protein
MSKINEINAEKNNSKNNQKIIMIKKELLEEKLRNNNFSLSNNKNFGKEKIENVNNKIGKINNYDFIYLSSNNKATKLLLYNNEKPKKNEIYSDIIYYILNGNKKKKGVLLITSQCFYILDDSPEMNCQLRISHRLLSSISLSHENFNHLLLTFNDGSYIIIEIYRRMPLLEYLKDLYLINKCNKLNIFWCDSFNINLKNHSYFYDLKNNKNIILTSNYENAQRMSYLYFYKDNFFSAYFTEKLIVLCSIGLIVFSKSNMNIPKRIIPIIGASIKQLPPNSNSNIKEKLYCFKIKTLINDVFIFGTTKKKKLMIGYKN